MEQSKIQSSSKDIQKYLWLNILAFIMAIFGPMFFWVGLPPFILSLMGIIYSRQAMVFEKTGEAKTSIVYSELASNYARFALWWLICIYLFAFLLLIMIKTAMPELDGEVLEFMTPMHGKLSTIMRISTNG